MSKIWIIGASSGIGAALARHYAGAELILSARPSDRLDAICAELGARALPMDIGARAEIEAACESLQGVDKIIHLAALYDPGLIAELDPSRAEDLVRVNLMGSFHLAQLAPKALRAGGQLAFCGSVAGYIGLPRGQIYSATKAAVASLAESLQAERPDLDIRLICPGFVETPMTAVNAFEMPMRVSAETAAAAIAKGLAGGSFEIHFPKGFTRIMKLLRALPYAISLKITRRLIP